MDGQVVVVCAGIVGICAIWHLRVNVYQLPVIGRADGSRN